MIVERNWYAPWFLTFVAFPENDGENSVAAVDLSSGFGISLCAGATNFVSLEALNSIFFPLLIIASVELRNYTFLQIGLVCSFMFS